jgi:ubiquinone biosynthesis protein UbiJ
MPKTGLSNSLITGLTAAIETAINAALRYDPASRQQAANITDILAIESTLPPFVSHLIGLTQMNDENNHSFILYCHGTEDGVRLMNYCEAPVSTHLKGDILSLTSLLKQPTNLANSGVELAGNIGLLQQWQALLQQLDIDWEDAISSTLGDIVGPTVASSIRTGFSWAAQQQQEQQRLLTEYLPEELRVTPSKIEIENFCSDVSGLTLDVDRLSARLSNIEERLKQLKDTASRKKEKSE